MRCGTLGILNGEMFNPASSKYVEDNFVYLTLGTNITSQLKEKYPKINRIIFETRWFLVQKDTKITCIAIYLDDICTPDEVVAVGEDFHTSSLSDNKWKYHKVLLSINDNTEVVFLHEQCLSYFTWIDTEDTSSHEDGPSSLPV